MNHSSGFSTWVASLTPVLPKARFRQAHAFTEKDTEPGNGHENQFTYGRDLYDPTGQQFRLALLQARVKMTMPLRLSESRTEAYSMSVFIDLTHPDFGKAKANKYRFSMSAVHTLVSRGRPLSKGYIATCLYPEWEQDELIRGLGWYGETRARRVDEALHVGIVKCSSKTRKAGGEDLGITFVVLTGDGASGEFQPGGFIFALEAALEENVKIELWSWKGQFSHRLRKFAESHPNQISVFFLDAFASHLVEDGPVAQPPHAEMDNMMQQEAVKWEKPWMSLPTPPSASERPHLAE
ncbi:hypothetical protein BOTBODRAFT_142884 [Botryobasidium botryosum FD-172 SS1]|uniref:NYN domain-containing protein n=1 Tax=Botryobasidium botryosum (strain FD-172 SS1) TaxID=930990 RepID=A0A067N567_BOTB1|nr:hypothetical protein BOTBODRAFT_142884 [Botryobasidium botryosum FD-172 SS1]